MIGIHNLHRRLAAVTIKTQSNGGWTSITNADWQEIKHCLIANAELVQNLDGLKELAFVAHVQEQHEWEQEICRKIEAIEVTMI